MADIQQILAQLQAEAQRLAASPLAVPVAASLGGLLLVIVALYALAGRTKKERTGTVYQGGVRRSTRCAGGGQQQPAPGRGSPGPPPTPPASWAPQAAQAAAQVRAGEPGGRQDAQGRCECPPVRPT